jgi:hypothetical protein
MAQWESAAHILNEANQFHIYPAGTLLRTPWTECRYCCSMSTIYYIQGYKYPIAVLREFCCIHCSIDVILRSDGWDPSMFKDFNLEIIPDGKSVLFYTTFKRDESKPPSPFEKPDEIYKPPPADGWFPWMFMIPVITMFIVKIIKG